LLSEAEAEACCADLYQSDMAKLIMGDTLHPGGLGLTNKLGRLMGWCLFPLRNSAVRTWHQHAPVLDASDTESKTYFKAARI